MKSKTINKILTGKFIAWTKSINDEALRKLVEENTIITGGSIVSLLLNEPVNDFDVYFRTPETAFAVAEYYVKKLNENPPPSFKNNPDNKVKIFAKLEPAIDTDKEAMRIGGIVKGPQPARVRVVVQSAGVAGEEPQGDYQYFEGIHDPTEQADATESYVSKALGQKPSGYVENVEALDNEAAAKVDTKDKKGEKYRVLFVTSNAISLSDQMQLILRFQGEAEQIHENFDYVHCTSYWTSWDKKLVFRPEALECILTKELRYIGSKYPICSVIRTRKFISRGWTINAGQYVKMAYQISKLDLNDANVLEDQLVGVDSAYFTQVIQKLREQPDPQHIDGTYLMTLIDKIF